MSQLVLVTGTGQCGLVSLAALLERQPDTSVTLEDPPLLPWQPNLARTTMNARFDRLRKSRSTKVIADVAAFYLPYLEEAIAADPTVRIIGLWRPREEMVAAFVQFLDAINRFPTNHWATNPAPGWYHDPFWTRTFPQYDEPDRLTGLRRYWDESMVRMEQLAEQYPHHLRLFQLHAALNTPEGQRELLSFVGYPGEGHVLAVGVRATRNRPSRGRPQAAVTSHPADPRRCVVLVPYSGQIHPPCDAALRELERRGYPVRRVGGFAAIDQARNQLATDALLDGFAETLWVDADLDFHPDAVDRLRSHGLPITCGVYAQKGRKAIACHALPGTARLPFGEGGGLHEILYAATGFLHIRREVYLRMQYRLGLPVTNERFHSPMIPFFQPLVRTLDDGTWYLAEDFAFSHRARECGYTLFADTSIRLFHLGLSGFGWEDIATPPTRTRTFTMSFAESKTARVETATPDDPAPPRGLR